jgi:drug/metabolite transporter (DMT)-like permease
VCNLNPILGLFLGWALLNEPVSALLLGAGALVALGLVLINRPAQVPQKV